MSVCIRLKIIILSKFNKKKRCKHIEQMEKELGYSSLEFSNLKLNEFLIGDYVQTNKKYYNTFKDSTVKGVVDNYKYVEYEGRPNTFHYVYIIKLINNECTAFDESWLELCN